MQAEQVINLLPHPYKLIHLLDRQKCWSIHEHRHSFYQCIYVIDGTVRLTVKGNVYSMKKGHVCLIPPGVYHALRTETGYRQLGIDFEREDQRGMVGLLTSHIPELTTMDQSFFLSWIPQLKQEADSLTRLSKQKIANLLDTFLLSCIESNTKTEHNDYKNQLIPYLKKRFPEKVTIDDICKHLNTSASQLQRFSYKEFGCGVIDFYNQLRINKACTLLSNPQLTIAEISDMLGFCDQAYFSRFFKMKMKLSPSEYRNDRRM